jgi:hypothetical protein
MQVPIDCRARAKLSRIRSATLGALDSRLEEDSVTPISIVDRGSGRRQVRLTGTQKDGRCLEIAIKNSYRKNRPAI